MPAQLAFWQTGIEAWPRASVFAVPTSLCWKYIRWNSKILPLCTPFQTAMIHFVLLCIDQIERLVVCYLRMECVSICLRWHFWIPIAKQTIAAFNIVIWVLLFLFYIQSDSQHICNKTNVFSSMITLFYKRQIHLSDKIPELLGSYDKLKLYVISSLYDYLLF